MIAIKNYEFGCKIIYFIEKMCNGKYIVGLNDKVFMALGGITQWCK